MAWTCSGSSNDELIDNLLRAKLIRTPAIERALRKVDRGKYVPRDDDDDDGLGPSQNVTRQDGRWKEAYKDCPQPIGFNATISAPHMHVAALESLADLIIPPPRPAESSSSEGNEGDGTQRRVVLDVGCGSGYLTAAIYHMLHPSESDSSRPTSRNLVVGIDHLHELAGMAAWNIMREGPHVRPGVTECGSMDGDDDEGVGIHADGGIIIVTGDGRKGCPTYAPYDAIHVGAAAPEMPQALIDQLKSPGRMFIPVGTHAQQVWQVDKDAVGQVTKKRLFSVRYVPLTDSAAQWTDRK